MFLNHWRLEMAEKISQNIAAIIEQLDMTLMITFSLKMFSKSSFAQGKLDRYVQGWGGNFRPWYDRSPHDEQRERSKNPYWHQRRGCSREQSLRFWHRTPERVVENHVQTVHCDGSELRHKLNPLERRPNSPQQKHEVIYVIARGFTGKSPSNNARKRHARKS